MKIKTKYLVILLLLIGIFLRFYNLNWGSPFYFHPDERNIASFILQTSLADPGSLLTGTFAYGNFPVILTHLLKPLFLPFFKLFNPVDPFAQAVVILRAISAIFSVLMLYVVYLAGKLWSVKIGLLALFLAVFSTGLIQQAHFGTYDGLAAFGAVTVFYFSIKFIKTKKHKYYYFAILFVSLGAAAKINLLILALFPAVILLSTLKKKKERLTQVLWHAILGLILLVSLTAFLSPNYLMPEFKNALFYERGLVTGETPVFYTQSFADTRPVLFQFLNIYPFLINPILTLILIPAFFYILIRGLQTKNRPYLILATFYLILFLPQAFLHAKWTRYMVPTLPFIYLIISISTINLVHHFKKALGFKYLALSIILISSIIFSLSFSITAFVKPDTRIEAAGYAQQNFPNNSRIITEPFDLGIMPFSSISSEIKHFNFYDLDSNQHALRRELQTEIAQAEYIILPSQRLIRSRLLNEKRFPKGYEFYSGLAGGNLGFEKVYETSCDIFCQITYPGDPIYQFEETATVFDRPTVFIFRKMK